MRSGKAAWLHRQPEIRNGSFPRIAARCPPGGGRGGVAVQSSSPARFIHPPGAHPHRRQLERAVAGTGGNAEPQRIHDQGRHPLQHLVEPGFHRRIFPLRAAQVAGRRDREARCQPCAPLERLPPARACRGTRRPPGRRIAPLQGHHGGLRRRLHGNVQRHRSGRAIASHRGLQRASEPVGPVRRDAPGDRCRGPGGARLAG